MFNNKDSRYLLYSIIFHISIVLIFTVKILAFPSERTEVLRSVRVDFVALPDKDPVEAPVGTPKPSEEEMKAEPPKPTPTPEPPAKEEKTVNLEKNKKDKPDKTADKEAPKKKDDSTKDDQKSSLDRLRALDKIKKMKEQKQSGPEGTAYKGNVLNAGSSLTGVDKLQHDNYSLEVLQPHIHRNFQLPEWLARKGLSAVIFLRFDESGRILERRFIRSSGNESFDNEVIQSIDASSPLPAPPESLISYFKVHGIRLGFPE
jgi:colicin import membrane protein